MIYKENEMKNDLNKHKKSIFPFTFMYLNIFFYLKKRIIQMQNLLHESTKDVIESKFDLRNAEKQWLNEKDLLLQELDKTTAHELRKDDEIIFLNTSNHIQNTSTTASLLLQENAYFEEE